MSIGNGTRGEENGCMGLSGSSRRGMGVLPEGTCRCVAYPVERDVADEQKSLVILTHLPFPAFFASVLDRVAPVFFEHGYSALEAACHAMASW